MTSVAKPSLDRITKALAVAGAFVAFGCGDGHPVPSSSAERVWVHQGEAQGTTYTVKYVSRDSVSQAAFEACLEEVDVEMNAWRPSSTLSQFNASTEVDTAFSFADSAGVWEDVWRISEDVHRLSGGAFDVTVGPLMKLWGFRMERRDVVTQAMVDSVRQFAHFADDVVRFVPKSRAGGAALSKSDPRTELDFNAVAQGYTVDAMAQVLLDRGVTNMMVELGGEVKCLGLNHGQPWRIAIDRPQEEGRTLQAVLPVADMSICTSGNYRKVSVVNGQRFSHTLDPRTGLPRDAWICSAPRLWRLRRPTPMHLPQPAWSWGQKLGNAGSPKCKHKARRLRRCSSWMALVKRSPIGQRRRWRRNWNGLSHWTNTTPLWLSDLGVETKRRFCRIFI